MSTDKPDESPNWLTWLKANRKTILWLVTVIAGLVGSWKGGETFAPLPPPEIVERIIEKPVLVHDDKGAALADRDHGFGWLRDQDLIDKNLDAKQTLHFDTTPAGQAAQGDEDVFLYRAVRKVNNRGPPWYCNINQGNVGSCVGAGSKHGTDIVQATAIAQGLQFEWKPVSAEVIYAISRVDVGGGRLRGDGSVGRWACEALHKGAMAPMERIGSHDLTSYSAARARQWGSSGVPAEVKAVAKQHPVKGAALCKSAVDVKRALSQGYPVVVCSDVGFNNSNGSVGTRDKDGFIKPRGTWPHCMCFVAWRSGERPGALCLNSWGDAAHGGPVWPEDMPVAAFWIDEQVVQRMVSQGDSFALSDVVGFPARNPKPDWFVQAPQARPARESLFALAW